MKRTQRLRSIALVVILLATTLVVGSAAPTDAAPTGALPWWDNAYDARTALTITTNDALPDDYTMDFTFDHAAMVAAGKSLGSGNDVRVLRWDGASWDQVDRVLLEGSNGAAASSWNQANTTISFNLEAAIDSASVDTSYWLYFDNTGAGAPPADRTKIYSLFDDFDDGYSDRDWERYERAGTSVSADADAVSIYGAATDVNQQYDWTRFYTRKKYSANVQVDVDMHFAANDAPNTWKAMMGLDEQAAFALKAYSPTDVQLRSYRSGWQDYGVSQVTPTGPAVHVTQTLTTNGVARHYENGILKATRNDAQTGAQPVTFALSSETVGQNVDVYIDNVRIKRMVVNTPTIDTGGKPLFNWNDAYATSKQLEITTEEATPNGYTVSLTFDHQALVAQGQSLANGNDVRIVQWDGSQWFELDRVLAYDEYGNYSHWNNPSTTLAFRTRAAITAYSKDSSYWIFYGNAAATAPPAYKGNVYLLADDFYNGTIDPATWNTFRSGSGTINATGNEIRLADTVGANGAFDIATDNSFSSAEGLAVETTVKVRANTATDYSFATGLAGNNTRANVYRSVSTTEFRYGSPANTQTFTSALTNPNGQPVRVRTAVTADGLLRYAENGTVVNEHTGAANYNGPLSFGFHNGPAASFDVSFGDIVVRKYVANEPHVSIGRQELPWWYDAGNYSHRAPINVDTSSYGLPEGYSLKFTVDHATTVGWGGSLANGNDLRVVWWDGAAWHEIDRVLAIDDTGTRSSWNRSDTTLSFRTQAPIPANTTIDDYWIYFDNDTPPAPMENPHAVYDWYDDFSSNTIGNYDNRQNAGLTSTVTGGQLRISGTSTGAGVNNYSGIYLHAVPTNGYTVESTYRVVAEDTAAANFSKAQLGLHERLLLTIGDGAGNRRLSWWDGSNTRYAGPSWIPAGANASSTRISQSYFLDGTIQHAENGNVLTRRSNAQPSSQPVTLSYATNANGAFADIRFDDLVVRKSVPAEPTVSLGGTVMLPWNNSYGFTDQLKIAAGNSAIPSGYSMKLTIDHAAFVTDGNARADGNDIRLVQWNGKTWTELDRVLAVGPNGQRSAWNRSDTTFWFRTQDDIPANSTDTSYFLYYGDAMAGAAPANGRNVFDFYTNFDDPVEWDFNQIGEPGTVTRTAGPNGDNEVRLSGTSSSSGGMGVNLQSWVQFQSTEYGVMSEVSVRSLANPGGANTWHGCFGICRFYPSKNGPTTAEMYFTNTGWGTSYLGPSTITAGSTFGYQRYSYGFVPGSRGIARENGTLVGSSDYVRELENAPLDLQFNTGSANTAYDVAFDDVIVRKFVENEPTVTINQTPHAPSGLVQARPGGSPLAVGKSVNSTSMTFSGTYFDPDGTEGYLCIELRPQSDVFNYSATACSTAPVPSGQTATITVTGLPDGELYHWHALNVDTSGAYSEWAAFGNNLDSTTGPSERDFAVDTTAPVINANSIVQYRADGTTSIPIGGWTNESTFFASANVAEGTSWAALCVEAVPVGSPFTNTANACGSFGPAGSLRSLVTGATNGTAYHLQIKARDDAGNESAWVPVGANAESVADVRVDTTAPTGTVWDGLSTGTQTSLGATALDTLTANWSFTDSASGIANYRYVIGTTPGGNEVRTTTNANTSTSVTATGVTLQTGQRYYFTVTATDNAGNTFTATSPGQTVGPWLAVTIPTGSVKLGTLNSVNSWTTFANVPVSVSTNAHSGYSAYFRSTPFQTTGGTAIPSTFTGSWAAPQLWAGTGYGYTSTGIGVNGAGKFDNGTKYAVTPTTGSGDIIANNVGPVSGSAVVNQAFTTSIKLVTNATQPAGDYRATAVISVVPRF